VDQVLVYLEARQLHLVYREHLYPDLRRLLLLQNLEGTRWSRRGRMRGLVRERVRMERARVRARKGAKKRKVVTLKGRTEAERQ
jgi:hypothetical protein